MQKIAFLIVGFSIGFFVNYEKQPYYQVIIYSLQDNKKEESLVAKFYERDNEKQCEETAKVWKPIDFRPFGNRVRLGAICQKLK